MLTKLGKELRKFRIDADIKTTKRLAEMLGFSATFLSYIEAGLKHAPADFPDNISEIVRNSCASNSYIDSICNANMQSVKTFVLMAGQLSDSQLDISYRFHRRYKYLTDEQCRDISVVLMREDGCEK